MGIKIRITILNFLEFFAWGAWLISMGSYMMQTLHFDGGEVGSIYATMGIASLFMPALLGIVADRWVNAERLMGLSHIVLAGLLFWAAHIKTYDELYWVMLLVSMCYMPTIALDNTVSYSILQRNGYDVVKAFPPLRVWGTIGFIVAMWIIDFLHWTQSPMQLYFSSVASLGLGVYSFTMPACPPEGKSAGKSLASAMGLDAFKLFKQRKMSVFFIFSMMLGASLQITNLFGEPFLDSFKQHFANTFAVLHPSVLMSVSQMSETVFILTIPFFLKRFGIKKVMLMSMFAWVFRFGFFGIGNPVGFGLVFLILSMLIYGMAFDFFNISGSLFVEMEVKPEIRGSAQGLFMIMTNGFGAFFGGMASGWVVDYFTKGGIPHWPHIWFTFSAYSLAVGVLFAIMFKYKHNPEKIAEVQQESA